MWNKFSKMIDEIYGPSEPPPREDILSEIRRKMGNDLRQPSDEELDAIAKNLDWNCTESSELIRTLWQEELCRRVCALRAETFGRCQPPRCYAEVQRLTGLDQDAVNKLCARVKRPLLLPIFEKPPPPPPPVPQIHGALCIDLGTSGSSVAITRQGQPPLLARLLHEVKAGQGTHRNVVPSNVAIPRENRANACSPAVLGSRCKAIGTGGAVKTADYRVFRSLKRLLADTDRSQAAADPQRELIVRVTAMCEELLLQALFPEESGTARYEGELDKAAQARANKAGQPQPSRQNLDIFLDNTGFVNRGVWTAHYVQEGKLPVYVCVPNAFGHFEEVVIREATRQAGHNIAQLCLDAHKDLHVLNPSSDANGRNPRIEVSVFLVREAEAVAWWAQRALNLHGRERWLIYDIGGGSADSALVTMVAEGHVASIIHCHAGVSFAGDDLDMWLLDSFLRANAQTWRHQTLDQVLTAHNVDIPSMIQEANGAKVSCLQDISNSLQALRAPAAPAAPTVPAATPQPPASPHSPSTLGPQKPTPPGTLEDFLNDVIDGDENKLRRWFPVFATIPFAPPSIQGAAPLLQPEHYLPGYCRWLRAVVVGVLNAIHKQDDGKVQRVFLSGRGVQAPGVQELLTHHLKKLSVISDAGQVEQAPAAQGVRSDPEFLKLACVRGISAAAQAIVMRDSLNNFLNEEVKYGMGVERHPIWLRGDRFQGGLSRALIRLAKNQAAENPIQQLHFSQARCPQEVIDAVGGTNDDWAYRHMNVIAFDVRQVNELNVVFRYDRWMLETWSFGGIERDVDDEPRELHPHQQQYAMNPITNLPFDWGNDQS